LAADITERIIFPAEYTINLDLYNSQGFPLSEGQLQIQRGNKEQINDINKGDISFTVPPADYIMTIQKDNENIAQQPIEVRADKSLLIISTEKSLLHSLITIIGMLLLFTAVFIILLKRTIKSFIPMVLISLLVISLVMPWWSLTGETGQTTTHTNTLIYPPKIVTLTSTTEIQGGEIAGVPEELTTVLTLLSILTFLTIILYAAYIVIPQYRIRLQTIFSLSILIILLLIVLLFYLAMVQITEIGVGGVIGSGDIDITIPGRTGTETIQCSWGLSIGYYLIVIVLIIQLVIFIQDRKSRLLPHIYPKRWRN
jgi:hypothetical protein